MLRGYSFRPRRFRVRFGPLALAAAVLAAGIALGSWQTRRAEAKLALARQLDAQMSAPATTLGASPVTAESLLKRHVAASGAFLAERTIYLDNRNRGGKPGYEVVTPLALSPAMAVLVQRGWVERSRRETVRTPQGVVSVTGIALERLPRAFSPGGEASGEVRQNLDVQEYAKEIGIALQPVVIQQRSDDGDGLARDWPRPDFGVDTHRAYALQWYSLAALAGLLGVVFSFRRVA
jgi:surfeit locus 1 family protein